MKIMIAHKEYDTLKGRKIANDPTKHYPNKDEAHLLRKIMAKTGLTEKEIRADKQYRIQLSKAQKQGRKAKPLTNEITKWYQDLIKDACRRTGLVPQHPETLKVIDEIIKERSGQSWGKRWFLHQHITSAEQIVKLYAK